MTAVAAPPWAILKWSPNGVGPTVSYARKFGATQAVLDVSWLPQLHAENTTKGNFIWVKVAVAF